MSEFFKRLVLDAYAGSGAVITFDEDPKEGNLLAPRPPEELVELTEEQINGLMEVFKWDRETILEAHKEMKNDLSSTILLLNNRDKSIKEEEIELVMNQTKCNYEKAKQYLIKSKGDIVDAIMLITDEQS